MIFLVDDVDVDGWALFFEAFLLEEEAKQRRANSDSVVGSADHQAELLLRNRLIRPPALSDALKVSCNLAMGEKGDIEAFLDFRDFAFEGHEGRGGLAADQLDNGDEGESFFQINLGLDAYDALQQPAVGSSDW